MAGIATAPSNAPTAAATAPAIPTSQDATPLANQAAVHVQPTARSTIPESRDEASGSGEMSTAWNVVARRNTRKKAITGSKVMSTGTFRGVQQMKDLYIGRCHSSVTPQDIISYVSTEINVNAKSCVCISREGAEIKAFKLSVGTNDSEKLLNHEVWPENVKVRKFYAPRPSNGVING